MWVPYWVDQALLVAAQGDHGGVFFKVPEDEASQPSVTFFSEGSVKLVAYINEVLLTFTVVWLCLLQRCLVNTTYTGACILYVLCSSSSSIQWPQSISDYSATIWGIWHFT